MVAGYQGIVRDVTAGRETDRAKNEFLAMVTHDLRSPITTILGLAVTLEAYADELPVERLRRTGHSDPPAGRADQPPGRRPLRGLPPGEPVPAPRPAGRPRWPAAVEAVLSSLSSADAVEVEVAEDLMALADPRRLEQVVANLVENALTHGSAPVRVEVTAGGGGVELSVSDAGPGVPDALVPTLFAAPRRPRPRGRAVPGAGPGGGDGWAGGLRAGGRPSRLRLPGVAAAPAPALAVRTLRGPTGRD